MRKLATITVLGLAVMACESSTEPQALNLADGMTSFSISDGAHGGVAGFYFLPPMVKSPGYGGTFDAGPEPVVEVCETPACETIHRSFDMDGAGSERVRLDEKDEHYIVNWNTGRTRASAGQTYRVRVRVNDVVLGHADVTLVRTGQQGVSLNGNGGIALVAGQTLPVKFRVEAGIAGTLVLSPLEATVGVGETQQFTAELQDLRGEPLNGPAVSWSSDDPDVATVDADGLATGVGEGGTTIIASAGAASASAQLGVTVPDLQIAASAQWQSLGSGMNNTVLALTVHEGDLVAGGDFTAAGGQPASRIARWDGSSWQPLGTGMNGSVSALAVYEGELVAAGSFTSAGGQAASRIARWDGSSWQPLGAGTSGAVAALAVYEGALIAAGSFGSAGGQVVNNVARWDGSGWEPLGTGLNHVAFALAVHAGELIVGGRFSTAGGVWASRIARWDGSAWGALGAGVNSFVFALTVRDDELAGGGRFTAADGQSANRVAGWDGAAWSAMGSGANSVVHALTAHEGDLIAGGDFTAAGGEPTARIARWNGSEWQALGEGMNSTVRALTVHDGDVVAGGAFSEAGGEPAYRIARWGTP